MKKQIIALLDKHGDDIMKNTLGDSVDEYGEKYVQVYDYEWENCKDNVACTVKKIRDYSEEIFPIGFAYIILAEWSGVMTFSKGDLNMAGLLKVCENIISELNMIEQIKTIGDLIAKVKGMLRGASMQSEYSAMGFDQGFYVGKVKAFGEVLEILEKLNNNSGERVLK